MTTKRIEVAGGDDRSPLVPCARNPETDVDRLWPSCPVSVQPWRGEAYVPRGSDLPDLFGAASCDGNRMAFHREEDA